MAQFLETSPLAQYVLTNEREPARPSHRPHRAANNQSSQTTTPTNSLPPPCNVLGLPTPNSFLISRPKLWAATCIAYRLVTSSKPRNHVRLAPPVSHTWAKLLSTT